jgi:formylglycine-generating enzyme required for sulfatase activity
MNAMTRREWLVTAGIAGVSLSTMSLLAVPTEAEDQMVMIPAGPFLMGTSPEEAERLARKFQCHVSWLGGEAPQRTVTLPAFRMDKYPVTNQSYAAFVAATGHQAPYHWPEGKPPASLLDHPVVRVSRGDAFAYAKWAGKRLPTAAEWEKAARGAEGRLYPWGNRFDARACQHDPGGVTPPTGTAPVAAHPRGASPYGVMDLAGNVAEWCANGPGAGSAYLKGGCWLAASPLALRSAAMSLSGFDNNQLDYIGFRCVQAA